MGLQPHTCCLIVVWPTSGLVRQLVAHSPSELRPSQFGQARLAYDILISQDIFLLTSISSSRTVLVETARGRVALLAVTPSPELRFALLCSKKDTNVVCLLCNDVYLSSVQYDAELLRTVRAAEGGYKCAFHWFVIDPVGERCQHDSNSTLLSCPPFRGVQHDSATHCVRC